MDDAMTMLDRLTISFEPDGTMPTDDELLDITGMMLRDVLKDLDYLSSRHLVVRPMRPAIQLALALLQEDNQAAQEALTAAQVALRRHLDPMAAPTALTA